MLWLANRRYKAESDIAQLEPGRSARPYWFLTLPAFKPRPALLPGFFVAVGVGLTRPGTTTNGR
jgi:hypothetical protein